MGVLPALLPCQDGGRNLGGGGGDRRQVCFLSKEAGEGERLLASRVGH